MNIENRQARILIVDDNPKNIQVLGGALKANNYEVEFSTSGDGAIKWIKEEPFDLVLLDIMMPEMDGYETCQAIRKLDTNSDVPIIFLTAKTDRESILKGFKVGAQDYITKPFDSLELIARVGTHVELNISRKKLNDVNGYLERVVEERTRLLVEANREISTLDGAKSEFLNMISHEIRTPLNGIKGSVQLLKLKIEDGEFGQLLGMLDSSVVRLEEFSFTAILITRLQSGKYKTDITKFNAGAEMDAYLSVFHGDVFGKGVEIVKDPKLDMLNLKTDMGLFKEAFNRIVDNAIRYSPDNEKVHIGLAESDTEINIEIKDYGNGFPEKILDSKLKPFNPGETFVNKNMGLNLYLVNLIMQNLGGAMKMSNHAEGGACVTLTFKN